MRAVRRNSARHGLLGEAAIASGAVCLSIAVVTEGSVKPA